MAPFGAHINDFIKDVLTILFTFYTVYVAF